MKRIPSFRLVGKRFYDPNAPPCKAVFWTALCRNLLGCRKYISKLHDKGMPEILKHLYGINIWVCKICGGKLGKPQLRIPQRC